jgi:CO dehydrogenase/acetyl-CoA synthase gamma subunit (corrinoid Fe-S protein)
MTFDRLRSTLSGLDAWVIVLDTKGINVWCAAGKGTFGTTELINRIKKVRLSEIVSHRTIILPQLGAPGVAAHEVQKKYRFKSVYGPVRAMI